MKSLTELADDLHVIDPIHGSISRKARAAMIDVEGWLRRFDAERMKHLCPVCHGVQTVVVLEYANSAVLNGPRMPCPEAEGNCDGYISWRRIFAAVGGMIESDLVKPSPEESFREYLLTAQLVDDRPHVGLG